MPPRKTVRITRLIELVNEGNKKSTYPAAVRRGWNLILGQLLMEAEVYIGYRFLQQNEVPPGKLPGITGEYPNYEFPDPSRREYYVHRFLLRENNHTEEDTQPLDQNPLGDKE